MFTNTLHLVVVIVMAQLRVLCVITLLVCLNSIWGLKVIKEIKQSCSVITDEGTVDLSSVAATDGRSVP